MLVKLKPEEFVEGKIKGVQRFMGLFLGVENLTLEGFFVELADSTLLRKSLSSANLELQSAMDRQNAGLCWAGPASSTIFEKQPALPSP